MFVWRFVGDSEVNVISCIFTAQGLVLGVTSEGRTWYGLMKE
jgi:hypothetical protein